MSPRAPKDRPPKMCAGYALCGNHLPGYAWTWCGQCGAERRARSRRGINARAYAALRSPGSVVLDAETAEALRDDLNRLADAWDPYAKALDGPPAEGTASGPGGRRGRSRRRAKRRSGSARRPSSRCRRERAVATDDVGPEVVRQTGPVAQARSDLHERSRVAEGVQGGAVRGGVGVEGRELCQPARSGGQGSVGRCTTERRWGSPGADALGATPTCAGAALVSRILQSRPCAPPSCLERTSSLLVARASPSSGFADTDDEVVMTPGIPSTSRLALMSRPRQFAGIAFS